MGRGRRPNMALEPTRTLQIQRAFRQRKAEHLASLEDSVAKLTDENAKLRKLLHLPPNPNKQDGAETTRSASPSRAAGGGVSTPTSNESATGSGGCENCERMQEANRQLTVAAAQVEAQMSHLQQSIKALRSVLQHHNIPIPSPLVGSMFPPAAAAAAALGEDAYRHSKRTRYNPDSLLQPQLPPLSESSPSAVSGIQMTSNYFGAPSPSSAVASHEPQQQQYASSNRRPPPASSSGPQAWHTPSPSAILGAPTPSSASFSPRHAYLSHNSAHPQPEDSYYKPRHPPARQNSGNSASGSGSRSRQLPPPNAGISISPARQAAHLPPWSGHNGAVGLSSPAAMARHPALPALSPHSNSNSYHSPYPSTSTEGGSSAGYARSSTSNSRRGQLEEYSYEPLQQQQQYAYTDRYARIVPSPSAPSPSYTAAQSPYDHQQAVASPRHPPRDRAEQEMGGTARYVASSYGPSSSHRSSGEKDQKSRCGPSNADRSDTQANKACCPSKTPASSTADTKASSGCCGPKAAKQHDKETKWDAPLPLGVTFDMRMDANKEQEDKRDQKIEEAKVGDDDECCFGLVQCDAQGRIVI